MPRPPSRSRRPIIHFSILSVATASLALCALPSVVRAQPAETEQAVKDVENSKFSASGVVKSNAVYVRCGPGDNYYPTMKIDQGGKVSSANILRSIPPLDQAAVDAVRQWEFTPTLLNGAPVPVVMTVTVNFTLQ